MTTITAYQQRVNAEFLARQAPDVQRAAKEILAELKTLEQSLYWAFDPDDANAGVYWSSSLIDHAHSLLDMAHEYRAALRANPPPQDADAA